MASKSESPEILKATKDLEEISKEVETPQISETSSDESDDEKSDQSGDEKYVEPPRIYLDLDNTFCMQFPRACFTKNTKIELLKEK